MPRRTSLTGNSRKKYRRFVNACLAAELIDEVDADALRGLLNLSKRVGFDLTAVTPDSSEEPIIHRITIAF